MNIQVNREYFEDIKNGLNNSLISNEQWDPEKGNLMIQCEDDIMFAEVKECENIGQCRWLLIFIPIVPGMSTSINSAPISGAVREVIPEEERRPKGDGKALRRFLNNMTKPWHGYHIDR